MEQERKFKVGDRVRTNYGTIAPMSCAGTVTKCPTLSVPGRYYCVAIDNPPEHLASLHARDGYIIFTGKELIHLENGLERAQKKI